MSITIENELTKDAQYMLCALYKSYLDKRENDVDKDGAKMFGSSGDIYETFMSEWLFQDVDETYRELLRAGYLHNNIASFVILSDKSIIYMENRFKRKGNKIVDCMIKIKSFIPLRLGILNAKGICKINNYLFPAVYNFI